MITLPISKWHPVHAIVIFFFALVSCTAPVAAQSGAGSPTPTPKSEEVLKLEEEKAQAELRKAIAEANKAELEAKFPKPTTTPLAGTTTVNDNVLIEGQIVAYVSMAKAANKIVDAIKKRDLNVKKLVVFNEDDVKLLLGHKVSVSQLEVIQNGYCSLLNGSITGSNCPGAAGFTPIAGIRIAQSLLGSFVDLTSLLRTNVEIKGQVFDIDEVPLAAEVIRAARRTKAGFPGTTELYYPRMFSPDLNLNQEYRILGLLDRVQSLRNIAGKQIADLEKNAEEIGKAETKVKNVELTIEQLEGAISDRKTKLGILLKAHCPRLPATQREDPSALESRIRRYCPRLPAEPRERAFELAAEITRHEGELFKNQGALTKAQQALNDLKASRQTLTGALQANTVVADAVTQLKGRNEQFDKFVAAIIQASAGGGPNALTSYIRAENLQQVLKEQPNETEKNRSYWLQLKVVKAGGNNRIKTNLIWDIFTGGNRVSHSGGLIIEYILFDTTGQAITSDTITEYTNYIKANKIRQLPSANVDDMP